MDFNIKGILWYLLLVVIIHMFIGSKAALWFTGLVLVGVVITNVNKSITK